MRFLRQSRERPSSAQINPLISALVILMLLLPALTQAQQTTAGSPPPNPSPAASTGPSLSVTTQSSLTEATGAILNRIANSGLPERGAHDAKVTIIFFDDFQCPYCAKMYSTLFGDVMKEYGDRVKVILQPVSNSSIHPWAIHAAMNANCLAVQSTKAYWDFVDYVHANQGSFGADPQVALDKLALDISATHRLTVATLQECLSAQSDTQIKASYANLKPLGVGAVPTLFVNGESIRSAVSEQKLRQVIDRNLRGNADSSSAPATKGAVEIDLGLVPHSSQ
jgi:protein-disulfide isomerase